MTCEAIQHSDQMQCGRCGLAWDVSDEDPPACGKDVRAVVGRLDLSKALTALAAAGERELGITSRANEAPKPKPPPAAGDRVERRFVSGSARQAGKTLAAEQWMVEAVGRGEVVLQERRGAGEPDLLAFGPWRMPAELPPEALDRMVTAVYGPPGYPGEGQGLRTAYRELLAYLAQSHG